MHQLCHLRTCRTILSLAPVPQRRDVPVKLVRTFIEPLPAANGIIRCMEESISDRTLRKAAGRYGFASCRDRVRAATPNWRRCQRENELSSEKPSSAETSDSDRTCSLR